MTAAQTKSESMQFNADVSRLLDIVTNALYTNKDIFLRELISNAADACDKLRYQAIQKPELTKGEENFRIHIYKDTKARTLTVVDNGIGMTRKEMIDNLGTIAKSGTAAMMDKMKKSDDPLKLIGQFGVGFYASYMVADEVTVISRKAGGKAVNIWHSDGKTGFDVRPAMKDEEALLDGERGTAIILHLDKENGSDYLVDQKIKDVVGKYSDHVDVKIFLNKPAETETGEGQPINQASALWMRSKQDVSDEQYKDFYQSITGGFDEPLLTSHWRAEGLIEFNALLFIPTLRPWDLYDPTRKSSVRLYVRRVFISDELDNLMYPWMRFVRGVVDSSDLPLNISREMLQFNPVLQKIRNAVTRKVLGDLDKLSRENETDFLSFWGQFGPALKEGLYDAMEHRDAIFKVCRFRSTHDNGAEWMSLADYVERMPEDQKEIYYITGENVDMLKNSPQIEGFKSKGYEVLFLTDTVDDFWLQQVPEFEGKAFKSVTKGNIDLGDEKKEGRNKKEEEIGDLLVKFKEILKDEVEDVRTSSRLTDSPVCLVASEKGPDMHMERVLKIHQNYAPTSKPVLEINPDHPLILAIKNTSNDGAVENAAHLLMDQARIVQGEPLRNPAEFAKRMSDIMVTSLS